MHVSASSVCVVTMVVLGIAGMRRTIWRLACIVCIAMIIKELDPRPRNVRFVSGK